MANILVVDDEVGIRELFSEILSDEGYNVTVAANSQEARIAIHSCHPDAVLLDIWMPDTDGMSLLKEWASQGPLPCPIIMMSGHANIDMAVEATKFGAFLTAKPSIELSPSRPTQSPTQPVSCENQEEKLLVSLRNRIDFSLPLREARDQFERAYFSYLLEKENYSMTKVAARAQLERTHLYRKLRQLGIEWSKE